MSLQVSRFPFRLHGRKANYTRLEMEPDLSAVHLRLRQLYWPLQPSDSLWVVDINDAGLYSFVYKQSSNIILLI